MRRFIFVIIVAVITLLVLLFINHPELLQDIWLWIIGLIGPIIATIKGSFDSVASLFKEKEKEPADTNKPGIITASDATVNGSLVFKKREQNYIDQIADLENQIAGLEQRIRLLNKTQQDDFKGTMLTVLRYIDDGETTLGLLFFNEEFFCYTLEDTFREIKVKGQTRIPANTYDLRFNEVLTPLTEKYRKTRPWFNYHLEIQKVKNYNNVYIHSGGTHEHTAGCLLVSDSLTTSNVQKALTNSRNTFKRLYLKIGDLLNSKKEVRIRIVDEDWFLHKQII